MDFVNKVVIITGAATGIGAGAAEHFSKLGAKLVLTDKVESKLKITEKKCKGLGKGEVLSLVSDVTVEADRQKVISETLKKFGQIDVLVNNAGIGMAGEFISATLDQYDSVMNTNLRSVFHLTQLATPHLIKTKGNIVNISSVAGLRAFAGGVIYCICKAALDQFTRCVALELAHHGVRVNSINPSIIVTDIRLNMGVDKATEEAYLVNAAKGNALGRVGTVDDTAYAIAFLASNESSSFITGTTLAVDGGKAIMCPR